MASRWKQSYAGVADATGNRVPAFEEVADNVVHPWLLIARVRANRADVVELTFTGPGVLHSVLNSASFELSNGIAIVAAEVVFDPDAERNGQRHRHGPRPSDP